MIQLILAVSLMFVYLLYETDWLTIRLLVGREVYMTLPSGATITKEDYDYLVSIIKPKRTKEVGDKPCWYCSNGHDRQHIELGLMSYDLCECGASIIEMPKRKARKSSANATLAKEIGTRFARYSQANTSRMKKLC